MHTHCWHWGRVSILCQKSQVLLKLNWKGAGNVPHGFWSWFNEVYLLGRKVAHNATHTPTHSSLHRSCFHQCTRSNHCVEYTKVHLIYYLKMAKSYSSKPSILIWNHKIKPAYIWCLRYFLTTNDCRSWTLKRNSRKSEKDPVASAIKRKCDHYDKT